MISLEYRTVKLPEFNREEILRYAKTNDDKGLPMNECLNEMKGIEGTVVFAELDVHITGQHLDFGIVTADSKDLAKALGSCEKVLIFAATVGFLPDRLIAKYSKFSPTKAVLFQAISAERIESLCDAFCAERKQYYAKQGLSLKPRFSPGYGDLDLELQKDIITALDCNKLLGITLTESLLMMPSKSVTAIVGLCHE